MIQQSNFWVYISKKMKSVSQRYWTPMFTAAIFTIAKIWKQPNGHKKMNG